MKTRSLILIGALLALVIVPALPRDVLAQDGVTLTVVTHDSFAASEDVLAAFEAETGITLRILRSGDAGTMVNQSVLSRENPLGDVLYGVDNTFLTRALDADLFIPYESPELANVPDAFIIDDEFRALPVDYGDVCLNYDVAYFADNALPLPASLADLADPVYAGLLVVENPATSSPGLAFLLATVAAFGDGAAEVAVTPETDAAAPVFADFLAYWQALVANDVLVVDGWEQAYYGEFTVAGGGTRPLVVSYASSPPAEVYFAAEPPEQAPTASLTAPGMCFRQVEFVGILAGTEHVEAAQQFVDFMLGLDFQEDLPLNMFVFPVNEQAALPEVFSEYAAIPEEPVTLDIASIDANREAWVQAWTETVLR
ncbi:MAG: thiamine ABC transporter substrate-binding protein [Anaerolineae bacterium]|nr:thiamine ABC transporter substrate-binding protein [Anaerolineae bacterium]